MRYRNTDPSLWLWARLDGERICPAKGQRAIEFFQIFFKIPPGIANIFDHRVILWGRMNPHSSMPPSLALPLTHTHTRTNKYTNTHTQILQHNACQSALRNTALGYSSIDHSNPNICCSASIPLCSQKMDHFLILPQGFLLCSGVTRTWCKWEEKKKWAGM